MAKNLIDESKAWLPKFYNNGEWNDSPTLRFNGRYVEDNVVEFLSDFFHFLLESEFLSKETIIWLTSNMPSVKKAFELYNTQCDEVDTINIMTAQSNIHNDKVKLQKYFDASLIFDIITYPERNLAKAIESLSVVNRKYFNDKEYRQSLIIKIPKDFVSKNIDEYSWAVFTETLRKFNKDYIRKIEELKTPELTKEMVGYYNYLISSKRLNKEEKERLETIKSLIGITKDS